MGVAAQRISVLRSVVGARRATPRRIHGVRLAIAETARSERRIAVRGPGVGIDTSAASADPATWLKPVGGRALEFRTVGQPNELTLVPLNCVLDERYAVYWKISA